MGVTNGRAPAVRRAAAALDVIAHAGGSAQAVDIGRDLGLAKSSTSDLINTMLTERLLGRRDGALIIGDRIAEVAAGFVGHPGLLKRFIDGWQREPQLREHTASVQVLIGTHSLCVEVRISPHVLPYTPRAGSRLPLWDGTTVEPVATQLPRADVDRALQMYGDTDADDAAAITDWLDHHPSDVADLEPHRSATGNDELIVPVAPRRDPGPPVVITVHLPPDRDGDDAAIGNALEEFARSLTA